MQSRSFLVAEIAHSCLRLKTRKNARRLFWNISPGYASTNSCHNLRRAQLHKAANSKKSWIDLYDTRRFCHSGSQNLTASEDALEGFKGNQPHDQTIRPRPQSNWKLHASYYHEPLFRTVSAGPTKTYATIARNILPGSKLYKEQKAFYTPRPGLKGLYHTPTSCLTQWLDAKSEEERWIVWNELSWRGKRWDPSLPTILLQYLQYLEQTGSKTAASGDVLDHSAFDTLKKFGFSIEDVHLWATIVNASTDEEAALRYLSSSQVKPIFILLEVLRRPRLPTASFRALLIHSWDRCLGLKTENLVLQFEGEVQHATEIDMESLTPTLPPELQPLSFGMLISRLLIHSRRVWAPAVISISHMFILYWKAISSRRVSSNEDLPPKLHAAICKAYNRFMCQLAVPASMAPMRLMHHHWDALRLLLESAGRFSPSVVLSQASYSAVSRVLLASKKSELEVKYAGLLQRSWPPWRKDQDGMDVDRSPEDDISRAVSANYQMKEAGYRESPRDEVVRILGGREADGSPTIPTRTVVRFNPKTIRKMTGFTSGAAEPRFSIDHSAARIVATRDAREAWAIFLSLITSHSRPTYSMYRAMLEKLIFHAKVGGQTRDFESLPGSAKEPIALPDDNLSQSERFRTHPPDFRQLYAEMVRGGIRPSGELLEMLVVNAANFHELKIYLEDSGMSKADVLILTEAPHQTSYDDLERIPSRIIIAFIQFLSNIAHLYVPTPTKQNPIFLAFDLVKLCRTRSPVALYALITGLGHPKLHLLANESTSRNRMMAWGLVSTALGDFQKMGGDLDPHGLGLVCRALERALPAFEILFETVPAPQRSGLKLVKKLFANLSRPVDTAFALPGLLFDFRGAYLHAYVRVLCLSRDMEEILTLLQWMVLHQKELAVTAEQSRNGGNLLRRTLIAIRALLELDKRNKHALLHQVRHLVDQLDGWGGWPTCDEVDEYLGLWTVSGTGLNPEQEQWE